MKVKWTIILLVAGIVLLGAVSAWAAKTWTVGPDATTYDYTSIQAAIDAANPGDTINVAPGVYHEYLHIVKDNLTIQGAGIDQTILDLDGLTPYWHYDGSHSYASRAGVLITPYKQTASSGNMAGGDPYLIEKVVFEGFTVKNAGLDPPGGGAYPEFYDPDGDGQDDVRGIIIGSGKDVIIKGCKVENNGDDGISFGRARRTDAGGKGAASTNPTIQNCVVTSNKDTGIYVVNSVGGATITGNIVSNNRNPVRADDHAKGIVVGGRNNSQLLAGTIANNTVIGNAYYGIEAYAYTDGVVIENNTVVGHNLSFDGAGIFVSTGGGTSKICANNVVRNNIVTGNIRGIVIYFATNTTIEGNSITTESGTFTPGQAAIKIDHSTGATIKNNLLGTTGPLEGYGIRVTGGSSNNLFVNNTIQGADFLAIYVSSGGDNNTFTGNTITGATLAAFGIRQIGTGNTFTSNTISSTPWVWYTNYSIQTVLQFAHSGDSIYVGAGNYEEQIILNKNLVLQGEPGASIKSPGSQTYTIAESTHTFDPIVFAYGGTMAGNHVSGSGVINTDVKDLDIDGQNNASAGSTWFTGVLYRNVNGTISGNTIHDMFDADGKGNGPQTFGILVYGDSAVDILNNVIGEFSRGGIVIMGDAGNAPDPVAHVKGNTVTGNGLESSTDWWAENGIQVGYGATGDVTSNTVTDCWVNNPNWTATGIIIPSSDNVRVEQNTVMNNQTGIAVSGYTIWGLPSSNNNQITENDVLDNEWGISLQMDANNTLVRGNNIHNNSGTGITVDNYYGYEPVGTQIRYNSIVGNAWGIENYNVSHNIDAALNWWGDSNGPSADLDKDGVWDYYGGGDGIRGMVIFSPWLGTAPDGDPTAPGVQITGPMLIIVDDIGPAPAGGYLNAAIAGANSPDLPYTDTIEVKHGTYDASTPITDGVNIVSEPGSAAHTTLNGNMSINGNNITIGLPLQGFRVNGNLTVGAGANAATSKINWCDFYGNMTNNGTGTFDAQYNYWGTQLASVIDGRTTGAIDYEPFLPKEADASYRDIQALLAAGVASGLDPAIDQLWLMTRLGQDVGTFIQYQGVAGAGAFRSPAPGAAINLGGAAGGGGAVTPTLASTYKIGDLIQGTLTITDPVTGAPITDAAVTLSLLGPDGSNKLAFWGSASYNANKGVYEFSVDTSGLAPGTYKLIIQTDDGQSKTISIEIQGA